CRAERVARGLDGACGALALVQSVASAARESPARAVAARRSGGVAGGLAAHCESGGDGSGAVGAPPLRARGAAPRQRAVGEADGASFGLGEHAASARPAAQGRRERRKRVLTPFSFF